MVKSPHMSLDRTEFHAVAKRAKRIDCGALAGLAGLFTGAVMLALFAGLV